MTAPTHWTVSGTTMSRTFITEDYDASFDLAMDVKEIADDLNHHPEILITPNRVSITTTTRETNTLTQQDYELAEAINDVYDLDYTEDDIDFDDDSDIESEDEDTF